MQLSLWNPNDGSCVNYVCAEWLIIEFHHLDDILLLAVHESKGNARYLKTDRRIRDISRAVTMPFDDGKNRSDKLLTADKG